MFFNPSYGFFTADINALTGKIDTMQSRAHAVPFVDKPFTEQQELDMQIDN